MFDYLRVDPHELTMPGEHPRASDHGVCADAPQP
jgi:hypothetical protein